MLERLGGGRLRPVVMDFGLARDSGASVSQGLTESGAVIGTPAYMSPEQARGEARRLDRRSDVYSLGATLYDLLSGKPPFQDETVVNLLLKVMNDSPAPLRSQLPDVPEALDLIVSKCLNKEAEQRYPTALAFAQDLDRFLSAGRVQARRLGYLYRLRYFSKRNRALSALALALIVGGIGSIAVVIRNHVQNLRRDAEAKAEAALAQTLGQSVKDLEWLVRTAYLLPLHDTSYEKGLVRQRMATIHKDLQTAGEKGARLGAYVLGRGHLALHEWDAAYEQLSRAEKLGYRDAGLDFALGRVLGEKYSRALDEARKSGDKTFVEKRKKELEKEFLFPARSYLVRSRGQTTESPSYVEALLDFYNDHHDAALLNAYMARKQAPWLYEAAKLEGDVHMLRALAQRDHGDNASAEASFAQAVARYEEAAAIGHSDHQVHEALAEAWIRQEEMDLYRGIDPTPKMQKALTAADHAIEAAPKESYGHTKKAFAYMFAAQYFQKLGQIERAFHTAEQSSIEANISAAHFPHDPYTFDILGISLRFISEIQKSKNQDFSKIIQRSYSAFETAISINPNFPWALSDLAGAILSEAEDDSLHNRDPSSKIKRALGLTSSAIHIDKGFTNAHITMLNALIDLQKWNIEHGMYDKTLISNIKSKLSEIDLISKGNPLLDWNRLVFYQSLQQSNIDKSINDATLNQSIIAVALKLASSFGEAPEALAIVAESYLLTAIAAQKSRALRHSYLKSGLAITNKCIKLNRNHPGCMTTDLRMNLLQLIDTPNRPEFTPALAIKAWSVMQSALNENRNSDELLISCMEVSLLIEQLLRPNYSAKKHTYISHGRHCGNTLAMYSLHRPRSLGIYAAILFYAASQYSSGSEFVSTLKKSRTLFMDSFSGNANLRNRFGETAKEVERKLAELEAGR